MPTFDDSALSHAPPEEVWKLLYDPGRFPEWWAGMATVRDSGDGSFTFYADGWPDFPMPQLIDSAREERRVVISCQVSDLEFEWRLEPDGDGTRIDVHVEIPDKEAERLEAQREVIRRSVARLAEVAAA
ncbi:MAG: SRPBCC family protein [Thermoleophilaceae bacterium]